jgi:hypothetical protein
MLHRAACSVVMKWVAGFIFLRWKGRALHHWRQMLMLFAGLSVDVFNAISRTWTTAALSVARFELAATSLPDQGLAIFAGGNIRGMHVCRDLWCCIVLRAV